MTSRSNNYFCIYYTITKALFAKKKGFCLDLCKLFVHQLAFPYTVFSVVQCYLGYELAGQEKRASGISLYFMRFKSS